MNDAALDQFRALGETLGSNEPKTWQWIGPHMSQRMFGISERRARAYAERHGGIAKQMKEPRPMPTDYAPYHKMHSFHEGADAHTNGQYDNPYTDPREGLNAQALG